MEAYKINSRYALEPNHSHYILVDNGKIELGGEIEFRNKFESSLAKRLSGIFKLVYIVIEGDLATIKMVLDAASRKIPCIFIEAHI